MNVTVRERWVGRLLYPLFGLAFAFLLVGSVWDVSIPGIILCGGMATWCFVLGFGSWRSRLVVGPDVIRLFTLRGEVASIRWADVSRIHYNLSRVGAAIAVSGDTDSVAVDQVHYSMRAVRSALRPGLDAHRRQIDVEDPVGVLGASSEAR